mmetsp:Transcript_28860/g.85235  ORF Transcript_28860/g.85235 Transcript_28860/m.85235 type:complete len:282 (-) Transcript_28860:4370-5215(-)
MGTRRGVGPDRTEDRLLLFGVRLDQTQNAERRAPFPLPLPNLLLDVPPVRERNVSADLVSPHQGGVIRRPSLTGQTEPVLVERPGVGHVDEFHDQQREPLRRAAPSHVLAPYLTVEVRVPEPPSLLEEGAAAQALLELRHVLPQGLQRIEQSLVLPQHAAHHVVAREVPRQHVGQVRDAAVQARRLEVGVIGSDLPEDRGLPHMQRGGGPPVVVDVGEGAERVGQGERPGVAVAPIFKRNAGQLLGVVGDDRPLRGRLHLCGRLRFGFAIVDLEFLAVPHL